MGGAGTKWGWFMEDDRSVPAEKLPQDACQVCGSLDVHHRSYSLSDDEQDGKLVVLCEDCHRARLGP
jgi:hypothetical protein